MLARIQRGRSNAVDPTRAIAVSVSAQFHDDDAARNQHWQLQSVLNSTITTRLASNVGKDSTRSIQCS
ncbi:hypothetical protein CKO09_12865 [Chromatium weissei]|nr:hypothetical protein [Chromatium weissei]